MPPRLNDVKSKTRSLLNDVGATEFQPSDIERGIDFAQTRLALATRLTMTRIKLNNWSGKYPLPDDLLDLDSVFINERGSIPG